MKIIRSAIIVLFVTIFTFSLFAQIPGIPSNIKRTPSEQETKENLAKQDIANKLLEQKKLVIEQILLDAAKLELPKDRAWALAKAGAYLCKIDKPRAEKLFERSIKELLFAQNNPESANKEYPGNLPYASIERHNVLRSIGNCDPELAYTYLYQTRSLNLSQVISDFYRDTSLMDRIPKEIGSIQSELSKETNLRSDIIRKNPKRAVELISQDLNTFISDRTLERIKILNGTDQKQANQLLEKAVSKLLETKFFDEENKNLVLFGTYRNYHTALIVLRDLGMENLREKYSLKISDELLIKLADKVSEAFLKNTRYWIYEDVLKTIQRILPDRFVQIEQMKADRLKTPEAIESKKYNELTSNNPTSETLLSGTKDFSEKYQARIQRFAACTLVKEERFAEAENLLKDASGEDILSHEFSLVIYSNVLRDIRDKQYERAETSIEKMPDAHLHIDALAFLAEEIYKQNPKENRQKSLALLSKAEKLLDSTFETISEALALSDIIPVYALIDPEKAFQKFDSLIRGETENSLKFNKSTKKLKETGILALISFVGIRNVQSYDLIVSRLNSQNFDRTLSIINKLKLPKSRISARLNLLKTDFLDLDFHNEVFEQCNP